MAIACEPDLLIMDEPTTGLDVTTEAVILQLIRELRQRIRAAVLFISHNLAVVANVCDRIGVLYAGQLIEQGRASRVLRSRITRIRPGSSRRHLSRICAGVHCRQFPARCRISTRSRKRASFVRAAPGLSRPVRCALYWWMSVRTTQRPVTCRIRRARRAWMREVRPSRSSQETSSRLAIAGLSRWFGGGGMSKWLFGTQGIRAVNNVTLKVPRRDPRDCRGERLRQIHAGALCRRTAGA